MPPRASILVPTHSHASTLGLAVGSALAQTVTDVEVLIIGDGVTAEVRDVSTGLAAADSRVRFFDHPKGANHGELYRDRAIRDARSDSIFYLCDDDLLMRDHVADLLELLETHTFVQSKNGYFTADGDVLPYAGDLAIAESVARILSNDGVFNFVSVTGTAHSRQFYLDANVPWEATPTGVPPDWFQWRKLLRDPRFIGATSLRMTALQFPSSLEGRHDWSAQRRLDELQHWVAVASSQSGQQIIDSLVARGDRIALARQSFQLADFARMYQAQADLAVWIRRPSIRAADALARLVHRLPIVRRSRRP